MSFYGIFLYLHSFLNLLHIFQDLSRQIQKLEKLNKQMADDMDSLKVRLCLHFGRYTFRSGSAERGYLLRVGTPVSFQSLYLCIKL